MHVRPQPSKKILSPLHRHNVSRHVIAEAGLQHRHARDPDHFETEREAGVGETLAEDLERDVEGLLDSGHRGGQRAVHAEGRGLDVEAVVCTAPIAVRVVAPAHLAPPAAQHLRDHALHRASVVAPVLAPAVPVRPSHHRLAHPRPPPVEGSKHLAVRVGGGTALVGEGGADSGGEPLEERAELHVDDLVGAG
eukprot:CAMPEP_0202809370 /NCGR_PEP_ID=MMETSP1389-20130828/1687_1 /ASSEMBLY_ACC=CAM_ASM_000865 /TAXON_ID=302021 /ORGANISM="Rhodomonas sp., Strain CCMP768" /LENGTH=192 /DNA_ID=CAMNT_0049479945 /DNA_START=274 /DNA_END=848 /DNA_ORIENTATION=+